MIHANCPWFGIVGLNFLFSQWSLTIWIEFLTLFPLGPHIAIASNDAPCDDVPLTIVTEGDVPSLVSGVDMPAPTTDIEGYDKDLMVVDIEAELEPLPLRMRPRIDTMAPRGMLQFTKFSRQVIEVVLLWESSRHLSHESFMVPSYFCCVLHSKFVESSIHFCMLTTFLLQVTADWWGGMEMPTTLASGTKISLPRFASWLMELA